MDWGNESVLEFIELLQREPCIWNHKSKDHKNRNLVNEAWVRISNNFSVPCSVEELKKKRNTLLTQYRDCLRKIKESQTGSGDEVYRPSWFAFDAIDSYMGDLYDYRPTLSVGTVELLIVEDAEQSESDHGVGPYFAKARESSEEEPLVNESIQMESNLETPPRVLNTERPLSRESNSRKRKESNADPLSNTITISKRQRRVQDLPIAKVDEDFSLNMNRSNRSENEDAVSECNLYGQLLAQKLKPLDGCDRLILMNNIDNLVFKYLMNVRNRSRSSRSEHLLSMNQTQPKDNRQPIDLEGPSTRSKQSQGQKSMQNSQKISNYEVPFNPTIKTETQTSP